MLPSKPKRVLMEEKDWTPFRNELFEKILCRLEEKNSAALYVILYDRAYHRGLHRSLAPLVEASFSDLEEWSGLDYRVVKKCLKELRKQKLVRKRKRGVKRSRTDKPLWEVPLAKFDRRKTPWTPVPRFIVHKFIPAYPNSVLLLFFLKYQNIRWENDCYTGVPKMVEQTGWSPTRVRDAIKVLSDDSKWRSKSKKLPRPLTGEMKPSTYKPGEKLPHHHVRLVRYENNTTVRPRTNIAKFFNVKILK
jgi:hypothetical protein